MRNPARKVSAEPDLYALSLRALTRRAYSIHEMREYLGRRAENAELVSPVIARLREQKYLDDAKYALDYARQHAKARRQGRFRIARELRGRGVPDQHIEAALEAVFAETDEGALVRARLKRQLSHIRGSIGERKIASHLSEPAAGGILIRCHPRRAARRHARRSSGIFGLNAGGSLNGLLGPSWSVN